MRAFAARGRPGRHLVWLPAVIPLLLFPGCAFMFETPGKVESIESRQLDMMTRIDSLATDVAANEELLRQLRAQSGSSTSELLERLSALAAELELALEDIRSQGLGTTPIVQDTSSAPGVNTIYDEAFRQYQRRDYVASTEGFLEIVDLYPGSALADDALYYLAMSHESDGQPHRAIEEYMGLFFRYPDSERAPAALYRAAMVYSYHNASSDRDRVLRLIVERYPSSEEAALAQERLSGT